MEEFNICLQNVVDWMFKMHKCEYLSFQKCPCVPAGIALLYLHLHDVFKEPSFLQKAWEYVEHSLKCLTGRRDVTFLCGDAGPLAIAAAVYHRLQWARETDECINRLLLNTYSWMMGFFFQVFIDKSVISSSRILLFSYSICNFFRIFLSQTAAVSPGCGEGLEWSSQWAALRADGLPIRPRLYQPAAWPRADPIAVHPAGRLAIRNTQKRGTTCFFLKNFIKTFIYNQAKKFV